MNKCDDDEKNGGGKEKKACACLNDNLDWMVSKQGVMMMMNAI